MSFATAADKFAGEKLITLVELTDGSTTYYWSDKPVRDTAPATDVFYEPRIVGIDSSDRTLDIGAPRESDLQIRLTNVDGNLDALFSDYSTFSPANTTATIKVGFESLSVADFETVATMTFARVVAADGDRVITLELIDDPDRALGEVKGYTNQEVYDALTTADSATYPARVDLTYGDRPVPIVIGRYPLKRLTDGVDTGPSLSLGTALGGQTFIGTVRMVAISRDDFNTDRMKALPIQDGVVPGPARATWDRYWDATDSIITWGTQSITLGGATWYVLVVKLKNTISEEGGITSGGTWRFSVEPYAPDRIVEDDWRVAECVQGVVQSAENFTTWVAKADATSWATVNAHTGTRLRMIIRETRSTVKILDELLSQSRVESYMSKSGKLAGFWLEPTPGGTPDYSGKVQLTEEHDALQMKGALSTSGRWSIANVVTAHYADDAWFGGALGEMLDNVIAGAEIHGGSSVVSDIESRVRASASVAQENSTSITNHKRRYSENVGGPLLYVLQDATALARRELDLRPDPRWIVKETLPWRAAQLELGDIVEVDHTAIPGWSADRACVVYRISYNFSNHSAIVTLVDFDEYLRGKTCLYHSIENWTLAEEATAGITIGVTQSSATVVMSGSASDWIDALQDDILHVETADNQWQGLIESIDAVGPGYSITIRSGGGDDGPTLADIVTESGITSWRILRGQSNRVTTGGLYAVALEDKYGAYGAADGFFRDDSTPTYTYQR